MKAQDKVITDSLVLRRQRMHIAPIPVADNRALGNVHAGSQSDRLSTAGVLGCRVLLSVHFSYDIVDLKGIDIYESSFRCVGFRHALRKQVLVSVRLLQLFRLPPRFFRYSYRFFFSYGY